MDELSKLPVDVFIKIITYLLENGAEFDFYEDNWIKNYGFFNDGNIIKSDRLYKSNLFSDFQQEYPSAWPPGRQNSGIRNAAPTRCRTGRDAAAPRRRVAPDPRAGATADAARRGRRAGARARRGP